MGKEERYVKPNRISLEREKQNSVYGAKVIGNRKIKNEFHGENMSNAANILSVLLLLKVLGVTI